VKESGLTSLEETRISLIIPTLNGGKAFLRCLEAIKGQKGVGPPELIVLDSESEDDTRKHAEDAGAKVVEVERARFNHGAVRDLGVRHATGQVLVFTVQDARAADEHWLRCLVEPLFQGAHAATSRILPRPEANPLARRTALDSHMASEHRFEADPATSDLAGMPAEEVRFFARFDDIASSIRADAYQNVPFKPLAMSEDLQWALDALRAGYKIVFAPDSKVYHCHEYGPLTSYRRYCDDARALGEILGLRPRKNALHALRGWLFEVNRDFSFLLRADLWTWMRYAPYAVILRAFQVAGQWRGSR
jgi:rhamnosyltransferase